MYAQRPRYEIELALKEAWRFIELHMLVVPATGMHGTNGFRMFSCRGRGVLDQQEFDAIRRAAAFPKDFLHHSTADRVWFSLAQVEPDTAVFFAFQTVEQSVRDADNFTFTDVCTDLVRRAFYANGDPMTDMKQPKAEDCNDL